MKLNEVRDMNGKGSEDYDVKDDGQKLTFDLLKEAMIEDFKETTKLQLVPQLGSSWEKKLSDWKLFFFLKLGGNGSDSIQ